MYRFIGIVCGLFLLIGGQVFAVDRYISDEQGPEYGTGSNAAIRNEAARVVVETQDDVRRSQFIASDRILQGSFGTGTDIVIILDVFYNLKFSINQGLDFS